MVLACAVHATSAFAGFLESEALYRQRVVPPADPVFFISFDESAAAGAPDPCAGASTPAALGECSYEGFLKATAAMSAQLHQLEAGLKPGQRTTWRRVQKAWLTYRTQACHFESSQLADGSARARAQWQCAARMTRERGTELARIANCREGDLGCPAKNRSGRAP